MPMIPAICNICGTPFPSGFLLMEGAQHTTFTNCGAGPCPKCGGMGHIIDGIYDFIGNSIRVIQNNGYNRTRIVLFRETIQKAKDLKLEPEQVVDEIQKSYPDFSAVLSIIPRDPAGFWTFIGALIALLTYLQLQFVKPLPQQNVVNNFFNYYYSQQQTTPKGPNRRSDKVGRNDKCPCGSGIKFKKCHGFNQ